MKHILSTLKENCPLYLECELFDCVIQKGRNFKIIVSEKQVRKLESESGSVNGENGENVEVAIKKLYEPLRDGHMARRVLRELRLLKLLQHENTVELCDLFTPNQSYQTLTEV